MNTARSGRMTRVGGAAVLAAVLGVASVGTASASTLNWNLSFNDGTNTLTALVTTNSVLDSGTAPKNSSNSYGYNITSISGWFGGNSISGLFVDNGAVSGSALTLGSYSYDNILFTSGPTVDDMGLGFYVGANQYNVYWTGEGYEEDFDGQQLEVLQLDLADALDSRAGVAGAARPGRRRPGLRAPPHREQDRLIACRSGRGRNTPVLLGKPGLVPGFFVAGYAGRTSRRPSAPVSACIQPRRSM